MRLFTVALTGALFCASAGLAEENAACAVAAHLATADFSLPAVAAAIADKRLDIAVIGTGSSMIAGPGGEQKAYPARLKATLADLLPDVRVELAVHAKARETAADMVKRIEPIVAAQKPTLTIWQTGTVDAMRRVDPDQFTTALEDGIEVIRAAKSDVVLMNMQYSPRTESMIEVPPYVEAMRLVALQRAVPLFDRFAIMRHWGELGTFDLSEITKKIDMAERVHDCVGSLLAHLIVEAAKTPPGPAAGSQ